MLAIVEHHSDVFFGVGPSFQGRIREFQGLGLAPLFSFPEPKNVRQTTYSSFDGGFLFGAVRDGASPGLEEDGCMVEWLWVECVGFQAPHHFPGSRDERAAKPFHASHPFPGSLNYSIREVMGLWGI